MISIYILHVKEWLLPGSVFAHTGSDTFEGFPTPLSFTARTLNTYDAPLSSPVTYISEYKHLNHIYFMFLASVLCHFTI